jgi:MoxR-like ATPase
MSVTPEPDKTYSFDELKGEIEDIRARINNMRQALKGYFVDKGEIIDLMAVATLAQEPLLLVGRPGTAKSDLVIRFCQALQVEGFDYFEYMLTKFTEPGEIVGPIDINRLKEGRYLRRVDGKLPEARIVFLDEIFKSNSAILNTLLTIINERKFYQDGQPVPVRMKMLFAATNEIPEFSELDALKDRFILKIESRSVKDRYFDQLIDAGLEGELYRSFNRRPWANLCSLEDFIKARAYLDHIMRQSQQADGQNDRTRFFPEETYTLFKRILKTLEKEDGVEISDRKIVKLYRLLRARAFLLHGGTIQKSDLVLLRYIPNRIQDIPLLREKVDRLLRIDNA